MTVISDKTILITGGASGIGRQLALKMAAQGGRIVLWDLDQSRMDDTLAEIRKARSQEHRGYRCDVSRREQVYEMAERVVGDVGAIDILINNAGCVSGKQFLECDDQQIQRTIEVNTLAHFWTVKAFLPPMLEAGGHIVTVASAAGVIGVSGLADYCASKWAAVGFNESLRVELRRSFPGVKTTVVCPYFVNTGMFDGVRSRVSWLLPILDEEVVADRILHAIRRNRAQVFLPRNVGFLPLLRIMPARWFDAFASLLGINRAMETFVGSACDKMTDLPDGETTREFPDTDTLG